MSLVSHLCSTLEIVYSRTVIAEHLREERKPLYTDEQSADIRVAWTANCWQTMDRNNNIYIANSSIFFFARIYSTTDQLLAPFRVAAINGKCQSVYWLL